MSTNLRRSPDTDKVDVLDHIESILGERDRLYGSKFVAAEIAVAAALASAEKAVNAAFLAQQTAMQTALTAQEKAVAAALAAADRAGSKAEIAADKRFEGLNELRGMVTDQQAAFMQRLEAMALINAINDRLVAMQNSYESKLESQRIAFEKNNETLSVEIRGLRESRSEMNAAKIVGKDTWGYLVAIAGIAMAVIFHFIK